MRLRVHIHLCMLALYSLSSLPLAGQNRSADLDTAFWDLSLRELEGYRNFYRQELDFLQQEKDNLILRGIADGEKLLESGPDSDVMDDIIIRLADLYFYKEKDDFLKAMNAYDEWLEKSSEDSQQQSPEMPTIQFTRSLSLYERIINEFPGSPMVDDAMYNKGFIYEELGEYSESILIYESLIRKFPGSKYVSESYMRMGEYYFNPPQNELHRAVSCYEKVIENRSGPRYHEALYKLGWSHYRLSQYPKAISFFTTLIESVDRLREINPRIAASGIQLRDEAIEYVAISFIDFGGPEAAESYVKQLGEPDWGYAMLRRLGDIYKNDKEDYRLAAMTYGKLRLMARHAEQAPIIQKKIIECYAALGETESAFRARNNLFLDYSPSSNWWKRTRDETLKQEVYKVTEEALRNNFHAQLKSASESRDTVLYAKAIDLGRKYLDTYAEDPYAYMIRWNVALVYDTKLYRYKEALQEYLTITMAYNTDAYIDFAREKGLATIKDAAENAIVVADSLYRFEQSELDVDLSHIEKGENRSDDPIPFTKAAGWLAMAYDNYLKLFPFEENTPTILANAGALYYTHNQFDESIKYFKTLLRYFPDSRQAQHVQYSILETYFGKKDYDSVENLAKKILAEDYPDDIKDKARQRLAESIFLKAQALSEIGRADLAAEEYLRLTLEVPKIDFADRAVFNAAREFEKIRQYSSAIRSYEQLRISYPGSSLLLEGLNNLAYDYGELGKNEKAADQYVTLVPLLKEPSKKKDALHNAHVFYIKAENWRKAIETGEQYINQYPDDAETPNLYFRIGQYWKNLGEARNASRTYKDVIRLFPDSPHGVEACYHLGRYYEEADSVSSAIEWYDQADVLNGRLKAKMIQGNDFYAAEALFLGTELLRYEFEDNPLKNGSGKRTIEDYQARQLQPMLDRYKRVAAYQTLRLPESLFRIGEINETFASAWANQEIKEKDAAKRAIEERTLNEQTTTLYHQAFLSYTDASQILTRFLQENAKDSVGTAITPEDSLADIAEKWLKLSQEKISEMLYQIAEVNTESINQILGVPIPDELSPGARLEYRSQVILKAVKPLLDVVVEAHFRNLSVSDSLGLQNQWTSASQDKIIQALSIPGFSFESISQDAIRTYEQSVESYIKEMAEADETFISDIPAEMVTLLESAKNYNLVALRFHEHGLEQLHTQGMPDSLILSYQNRMFGRVFHTADAMDSLYFEATHRQMLADSLFEATQSIQYEDMLTAYEDNAFYLRQGKTELLESAFAIQRVETTDDTVSRNLGLRLLKCDPDTYLDQVDLPVYSLIFKTDSTWQASFEPLGIWQNPDSTIGTWLSIKQLTDSLTVQSIDSTQQVDWYLQKRMDVPGEPIEGILEWNGSPEKCFVNGVPLRKVASSSNRLVITPLIRATQNRLAVHARERATDIPSGTVTIRYVPFEDTNRDGS